MMTCTSINKHPKLYFRSCQTSINMVEVDKFVKEEDIKVKEKSKEEQSVKEEYKGYIQVEDDKSYKSYISNRDYIMSPLSWSSSLSHQRGRGGRGNPNNQNGSHHSERGKRGGSSHHDGSHRKRHGGRGGRGKSDHHDGRREKSAVTEITTQDQLNEVTHIQANLKNQMSDLIGKHD